MDLLSKTGGLISLVNIVFVAIGTIFNMEAILVAMAEQTYFYSSDN